FLERCASLSTEGRRKRGVESRPGESGAPGHGLARAGRRVPGLTGVEDLVGTGDQERDRLAFPVEAVAHRLLFQVPGVDAFENDGKLEIAERHVVLDP